MKNNRNAVMIVAALVVIIVCLIFTAAGLMLYLTMHNTPASTVTGDDKTGQTPTSTPPAAEWTIESKQISKKTTNADVELSYPQIKNFPDSAIQTGFNTQVEADMTGISNEVLTLPATGMSEQNSANLDFITSFKSDKLLSVVSQGSDYSGGAHPNALIYTINYDLAAGKKLVLGDLFKDGSNYLNVLSAFAIAELNSRGISDNGTVTGGAGPDAKNFVFFDITANATGIEMIFPPYQVAAYAAGTQIVSVPTSVFSALLKPEYSTVFTK